jgi:hypothetical protein
MEVARRNRSKDDSNDRGDDDDRDGVEEQVSKPQSDWVRQSIRQLHGLYRGASLP